LDNSSPHYRDSLKRRDRHEVEVGKEYENIVDHF